MGTRKLSKRELVALAREHLPLVQGILQQLRSQKVPPKRQDIVAAMIDLVAAEEDRLLAIIAEKPNRRGRRR
jgi:hypothetical protein